MRLDGLIEAHVDGTPVREPGQGVGEGEPPRLLQPLGLRDARRGDGGEHGGEGGILRAEDLGGPGPGDVQLAPGAPMEHDRRDDTATAPAPAQGGDALMAVAAALHGPGGGLDPGARSAPPTHCSCRNSVISGNW